LDFEFRNHLAYDKEIGRNKTKYEGEGMHSLSEIEVRDISDSGSKRMVLPKLTFVLPHETSNNSTTNKDSKPPIANKDRSKSKDEVMKSNEKPLKDERCLTREIAGGRLTTNFKDDKNVISQEFLRGSENTSPYGVLCNLRLGRQSCISTTNGK
jgi:hypothetical protein